MAEAHLYKNPAILGQAAADAGADDEDAFDFDAAAVVIMTVVLGLDGALGMQCQAKEWFAVS